MVARLNPSARFDVMRTFCVLTAFILVGGLCPLLAQSTSDGAVVVNPGASGTQVLLYPGGKYERIVPVLRMPGETNGPIHLHMPGHHHVVRAERAPVTVAATPPETTPVETPPVAVAAPRRHRSETASVAPPAAPRHAAAPVVHEQPAPEASDLGDVEVQKPAAKPERQAPPPRVASIEPQAVSRPARNPAASSGTRRSVVLFAQNATDPSSAAVATIKSLADDLGTLSDSSTHVVLLAYGGARGEKSSDTRRLSLKRALVVRQLLIDDGVPFDHIDVRALGGVDDDGPMDRVDIFLKS